MVHFKQRGWIVPQPDGATVTFNGLVVNSSNVNRIAWPVSGEPLMLVEFANGNRYAYLGVSRQRAVACAYAKSVGEFLNNRIKPNFSVMRIR